MFNFAPILLFTYRRLETLKQTVMALKKNYHAQDSDLFIFSDAAKSENDKILVDSIRAYLKEINGFKSITIYEAESNKGLAKSVIDGVNKIIKIHKKVIVLEDDLSTTPNFLSYMNACLNKYEHNNNVFSVSGYSFNLGSSPHDNNDIYFLNRGWSWGWATWQDRWFSVDWDVKDYVEFLHNKKAQKKFSQGGSDLNKMLEKQMNGKLDSWAIRWFFHQFKTNTLTVYPVFSKIYNNGFDQDATHTTGSSKRYLPLLDTEYKTSFTLPDKSLITPYFQERFQEKMGIKARLISKLETLLGKFFL